MLSPSSETVALHKRLIRNPVVNYCFEGLLSSRCVVVSSGAGLCASITY